VMEESEGIW